QKFSKLFAGIPCPSMIQQLPSIIVHFPGLQNLSLPIHLLINSKVSLRIPNSDLSMFNLNILIKNISKWNNHLMYSSLKSALRTIFQNPLSVISKRRSSPLIKGSRILHHNRVHILGKNFL